MTLVPLLNGEFGPPEIQSMSLALDDLCKILDVPDSAGNERELLAKRLISFARRGHHEAGIIRDRMLRDIVSNPAEWPAPLVRAARRGALYVP